jgi:UDP-N-acetylglucosamine acyltransferase
LTSGIDIHPTAVVHADAKIAAGVKIGPHCVVGPDVVLESDVVLLSQVSVAGLTTIGARTRVAPFASLGGAPQSISYKGERTSLIIGTDCDIREHVTMNTGTIGGGGKTTVGDRVLVMVGTHIAHDCMVGNDVIFANNAILAGHCQVGDRVFMSGLSGCHQFIRIGEGAMVGGLVALREDIIPFGTVDRNNVLGGINIIGLKRRGATKSELHALRRTIHGIFLGEGLFEDRKQKAIANPPEDRLSAVVVSFLAAGGKRPIMKFASNALSEATLAE